MSAVYAAAPAGAGTLGVISVSPGAHTLSAPVDAPIVVRFDRPVRRDTVQVGRTLSAFGRWSGPVTGALAFSDGDQTVTLIPDEAFSAGETVMVMLAHSIEGTDGTRLRQGGWSWQFWTQAGQAALDLVEAQRLATRDPPSESTRAYGGIATDLNNDRFCDLTIVNEVSADLRVFLNRADGSGLFDDFLRPPSEVGNRASPSEPADFNADGIADICVANIDDGTVSVLLGNGDGTFGPQQVIPVGGDPRGIAVLDADGDGDTDIVNTNFSSDNLSLLINDGTGTFAAPVFFDSGLAGEWALAAADMNDDGLLDLVVGARTARRLIVLAGNGDGTFTPLGSASSDGAVWMISIGDVDGNGTEDVAAVNSSDNRAAIVRGDGAGGLLPPERYATDPFPLATDLGDLDGDGDLDWVTSSFAGDWFVFLNDGSGLFAFDREIIATAAASCALLFDADNDRDLDLALIDELADEVIVMHNAGSPGPPGDFDGDGDVDIADFAFFASCFTGSGIACAGDCCRADLDGDSDVDVADFATFTANFTGSQ